MPPTAARIGARLVTAGSHRTGAWFDDSRRYRYLLWRRWGPGPSARFVLLNPSTADEDEDDATIRRCRSLARAWSCDGIVVGNLFALRSRDPQALASADDPVGPANDLVLRALARQGTAVAGWGNGGLLLGRARTVTSWSALPAAWSVLGFTRRGQPQHPLYAPVAAPVRACLGRSGDVDWDQVEPGAHIE